MYLMFSFVFFFKDELFIIQSTEMSFHWQRFAGGVFGLYFWAQCSQDSLTALQGGGRKWKFGAFGEPVLLFITVLFISLTNKKITIRIFNLRSWGQDVVFFFF